MKRLVIHLASATVVVLAFSLIGKFAYDFSFGQRCVLLFGAIALLQILFIPRWPRAEALRQALRVKKGHRIEVEGR